MSSGFTVCGGMRSRWSASPLGAVLLSAFLAAAFCTVGSTAALASGSAAIGLPQQLRVVSPEQAPYGYLQPPFVRPVGTRTVARQLAPARDGLNALPASYSLVSLGRVGAVRNQGSLGTCWTFAATASLESGLMPAAPYDLSEDNMALRSGFGPFAEGLYDHGGNDLMATAYLTRWAGPVTEAVDAYGDSATPPGLSAVRHLQEVQWIPAASGASNQPLKQAVMDTGAVSVSVFWSNAYYNAATKAFYVPAGSSQSTNHAVTIVGWDDAYPRTNFNTQPAGDGAWLVRNSWGSGWGDGGYFWASYYDAFIGAEPWTYGDAEPADNYDHIYQYDTLGLVDSYGWGSQSAWFANHFVAGDGEQLAAVSFWALTPGTSYEIWYGAGLSQPNVGSMSRLATGSFTYGGYHTVALTGGPIPAAGQQFVIAVKATTPGTSYPIPIEMRYGGYSELSAGDPGQSFISSNGSSWTDFDTTGLEGNVCLKAFTSDTTESPDAPPLDPTDDLIAPVTADDADAAWHNEDVLVTLDADDGEGSGVALSEYRVDGGAWIAAEEPGYAEVLVKALPSHSADGAHAIDYRSTDEAGNREAVRSCTVKIDTRRPTTAVLSKVPVRRGRTATVRFRVADGASSSGTATVTIVISRRNGAVAKRLKAADTVRTNAAQAYRFRCTLARGKYAVRVLATDAAGNVQSAMATRPFVVR